VIFDGAGPISIGQLAKRCAVFRGSVHEAQLCNVAYDDDWIATRCRNLSDPSAFCAPTD
jgi:hypothetical protein